MLRVLAWRQRAPPPWAQGTHKRGLSYRIIQGGADTVAPAWEGRGVGASNGRRELSIEGREGAGGGASGLSCAVRQLMATCVCLCELTCSERGGGGRQP